MPTLPPSARHDLTDAEWNLLAPLLPTPSGRGRPRTWNLRSLVDGIFFRIRTGCPWRDVHERYGPWWRAYDLFVRLQATGVGDHSHPAARPCPACRKTLLGSQRRLHHQPRPCPRRRRTERQSHPASRGACRSRFRPVAGRVVNEDSCGDQRRLRGDVVCDHPRSGRRWPADGAGVRQGPGPYRRPWPPARRRPDRVLADKAYSLRANRAWLRARRIHTTISQPKDQIANRRRRGSAGGRPLPSIRQPTGVVMPWNGASTG